MLRFRQPILDEFPFCLVHTGLSLLSISALKSSDMAVSVNLSACPLREYPQGFVAYPAVLSRTAPLNRLLVAVAIRSQQIHIAISVRYAPSV